MKTVRNIQTGNVHTVNDDHFSVTSPDYELVTEKPITPPKKTRKRTVKK